ncbi:transmembrane protein [Gossypium australe]|uniref:Transmembrane protein n=1 Tax=Gossypium australe TaxID=47621 RepID=A0A5B6W364_9ROSI|nr:transmembrane protein [Gossypium australe]
MEEHSGFLAILKACVLLRGRTLTGLTLAVVVNLALAAIEALFHYRVVRAYHDAGGLTGEIMEE